MAVTTRTFAGMQVRAAVTTEQAAWANLEHIEAGPVTMMPDVVVQTDRCRQTIEGFGACFNELGWTALSRLSPRDREDVIRELFEPGVGAGFDLCRMPIGANDFSTDWYSYDEVDGDLGLERFSIDRDADSLVPFVRSAQRVQPLLRIWASPWSPPTWMKNNGHYACAPSFPGSPIESNGLEPHQVRGEGTDAFRLDEAHLAAYARYFGRFVDAYAALGIRISMVMPQNEFNSGQVFPSCTWTPAGLIQFLHHLGPEMERRGVEVFLGTLERADDSLIDEVLTDAIASRYVSGLGVQWAGKSAVPFLARNHPTRRIFQTEQECGDGRNDWRFARYSWSLMRHYLGHGATAYHYWNIALTDGAVSRWGWRQNSLVTVDSATGTYRFNPDYWVMKHVSAFVRPGARVLSTFSLSGHENLLAFRNPDDSVAVVLHNDLSSPLDMSMIVDGTMLSLRLPAGSFTSLLCAPSAS